MSDLRSKKRVFQAEARKEEQAGARYRRTLQKDRNKLSLPSSANASTTGFRHIETQASPALRAALRSHEVPAHTGVCRFLNDAQTGMLPGYPESAICVQRFDDSLNSAIHTTYRNWLRSSSMHEPRDPPLEVVTFRFRRAPERAQAIQVSKVR